MADAYKGIPGLARLDREVLKSYAGRGDATPLEVRYDASRTDQHSEELRQLASEHRKLLVKGYASLVVILVVGGFIIWQAFSWSSTLSQRSLFDVFEGTSIGGIESSE